MISQAGEVTINVNKNVFHLKCTFYGLVEMENRSCTGQGGLSFRIMSKTVGINDVTAIIYGGIAGKLGPDKAPSVTFEELGQQILEHGMDKFLDVCEEFLVYAMTGGRTNEPGKKKVK